MTNVTGLRFHELGESIMFQPTRGLLVSLGIALAFATLISRVPLNQTDVWLHLGFGRQWLETGKLNAGTLTPIAMPEAPGLNSYWLAQCAIGWSWQVGGVAGIQALHALAILARLLAMALLLRACGVPDRRLVLVVVVTIGLALGHAPVFRPQAMAETFAAPLLILVLWPGLMWWPWIVAGILLGTWGLFHGSFLIGFPLATAVAIGQGLQGNSFKERILPAGRWLAMGVIAIAILTVLHPSGFHALSDAIDMGRNRAVRLQDEWRPLWTNRSIIPMMLWAASVAWWAWAMAVACRNEKIPWSCLLPGLILALTPLLHQRLLVWWYLSAPILVARAFRPDFAVQAPITWRAWAGLAAATTLAIAASGPWAAFAQKLPERELVAAATPVALAEALAGTIQPLDANRPTGRVFASESLGDYLVWRWRPRAPVLLHSHVHLLPPEHYEACLRVKWALPGWEAQLDQWGVDLVLVEAETHPLLSAKLRQQPGWIVIQDEAGRNDLNPRARLFVAVRDSSGFRQALNGVPLR